MEVLLEKAQQVGNSEKSVPSVMNMIEQFAKSKGLYGAIEKYQGIWNFFKKQTPETLPDSITKLSQTPEVQDILQKEGLLGSVASLFTQGENNNNT